METQVVLNVRRAAEDSYASGLYCAESVLLALADEQGIESDLLPRIATGFCGGMSRMCGTCGALTGAMMGVGLALGRSAANQSVQPVYEVTQRLIREFEQEFGARNCDQLLGCDLNTAEGRTSFRENRLNDRCARYTSKAAEIAARLISTQDQNQTKPG